MTHTVTVHSAVAIALSCSLLCSGMEQRRSASMQNSPRTSSAQNSPRNPALNSPRLMAAKRLSRSGSNSDVAIAAVATITLKRVTSEEEEALKAKRTSIPALRVSSSDQLKIKSESLGAEHPISDEQLLKLDLLRQKVNKSKSPRENNEADLVYGEQDLEEALRKLEALKTPRNSFVSDDEQ